jgi:hypothetical protein
MDASMMQQMTGMGGSPLPVAPAKKSRRLRGRGGAGRGGRSKDPLNQHHAAFMKAHAAGNHDEARRHALNYANASRKTGEREPDPDDAGEAMENEPAEQSMISPAKKPGPSNAAKLAALLKSRKK